MRTRCPYAECAHEFEIDEHAEAFRKASNGFFRGCCEHCLLPATFKPLDLIAKIERKEARITSSISTTPGTGANSSGSRLYVLLDDLRSLHNVGSIFRTADAFSFAKIFLCGITGTPEQAALRKTSLSAEKHVAWQYDSSALNVTRHLKSKGVRIISLEKTPTSIELGRLSADTPTNQSVCLVLGNEVSGVSEEVLALSDRIYHIPMLGAKESLNVAVAFGIAAYSLRCAVVSSI